MKKTLSLIFIFFISSLLFSQDQSGDDYYWIKNEKIKSAVKKIDKYREDNKSKAFFSGNINFVLFYYYDIWQGMKNDHLGDLGYSTRNFTNGKYHDADNKGTIETKPWGNIATGFNGNFCITTPFFESNLPLLSDNSMSFDFNWDFNWMEAGGGLKFTISPVPFYYSSLSINMSTGWEWLWADDGSPLLLGLGLSTKDGYLSTPLLGPVLKVDFVNGLQMDFSALPGGGHLRKRWTHIIITVSIDIGYQGVININQNQLYVYLNVKNETSGWKFSFTSELGYMIPVIEDKTTMSSFKKFANRRFSIFPLLQTTVGFDITHFSDSTMKKKGWGSDFIKVSLKPLLIFLLPDNFKFIIYSNFINEKRFTMESIGNVYFKNREYEDWYFMPENIGFIFGWSF